MTSREKAIIMRRLFFVSTGKNGHEMIGMTLNEHEKFINALTAKNPKKRLDELFKEIERRVYG
jgi:hypothetical protein